MVLCGLNQVEINDNKYKKKKDIRNLAICKKCTGVLFFHPNCLLGRHSAKTDIFSFPSSVVLSSTVRQEPLTEIQRGNSWWAVVLRLLRSFCV